MNGFIRAWLDNNGWESIIELEFVENAECSGGIRRNRWRLVTNNPKENLFICEYSFEEIHQFGGIDEELFEI